MSSTPAKICISNQNEYKTPKRTQRSRTLSLKAVENLIASSTDELDDDISVEIIDDTSSTDQQQDDPPRRRSTRKISPSKRYQDSSATYSTPSVRRSRRLSNVQTPVKVTEDENENPIVTPQKQRRVSRRLSIVETPSIIESPNEHWSNHYSPKKTPQRGRRASRRLSIVVPPALEDVVEEQTASDREERGEQARRPDLELLQEECIVAGQNIYGFSTPKKRNGMALAAMNTPKTPRGTKTPKTPRTAKTSVRSQQGASDTVRRRRSVLEHKTPSLVRQRLKKHISQLVAHSDSDFSEDESDFEPSEIDSSSSIDDSQSGGSDADDAADDEPATPRRGRKPIVVPILPKTPSAARLRQSARSKKSTEYVPDSDNYFQSHSTVKSLTSDHTLDRLNNPRLPADRLFSLLKDMKMSCEHEASINAIMEEYYSYFPKWMCILNEGFNLLLYGLGSKRQLLQAFHRVMLPGQTVLVINGFFPSLTIKDILDSITADILDAGPSPTNPHEAVDMIDEEFSLIPDTHLYLIVHNLDGALLRNTKAQSIISRLAKVPNIHLVASIDHINTPLLWDQAKLSNFNFSWWDCSTMLPYTDETAYENSLLVQNSGELALSSMRNVFSSLTTNSRGIFMLIVKYQLKNKSNQNFQGMPFRELYSNCREAFLVSSDLSLRAQLTEFLDHKLVKSKRSVDGTELLNIPIDSTLLQQFLDEQENK